MSMPTCEVLKLFTRALTLDVTVASYGTYYFDLANCNSFAIANLSFSAHTVNPNSQELSSAIIPVPMMWIAFTLLWLAILIIAIIDALRLRAFAGSARFALVGVAVIKLASCFVSTAEVEYRSIYGVVDTSLELGSNAILAVLRATALTLAVGLSSGWLLLTRKPFKPMLLVVLFVGVCATSVGAYILSSGLMQLFIEFISLALLIGACLWAVRNTNYNLYRFTTWVPTTVRRRVPGAVSSSETDTATEDDDDHEEDDDDDDNDVDDEEDDDDDNDDNDRRVRRNNVNNNNNNSNNERAGDGDIALVDLSNAAVAPAIIAVENINDDVGVGAAAAQPPAQPVRRRRRVPAAVEWVEVRPGERRAVLVRVALFTALRRALLMLMGGAGVVLCASLLLAHSDDTWLVSTVTETWLVLVFIEVWVALRIVKSNILEPPPHDDADNAELLREVDRDAGRIVPNN
jgi:hypothetical protein